LFFGAFVSFSQIIYQLRIKTSVLLPGAVAALQTNGADVQVNLQEDFFGKHKLSYPPADFFYVSPNCDERGHPSLRVGTIADSAYFVMIYSDGVRFAIDRSAREVWMDWPETSTLEDAATYLMGPVLGFVLRLRGMVSLHASAVAIGNRAIALVGEGGAGKSTTAAAFACLGYAALSDDLVPLVEDTRRFFAQPGYPRINLWPDSVRALFGSDEALPRITPTWEKRFLALDQNGHRFETRPLPLMVIYALNSRDSSSAEVSFETLTAPSALMTLVRNTYVNYLLDAGMRRQEFDVLSRLVAAVPVRSARLPDDPSRIREFCEVIAADAREQFSARGASVMTGYS
jgi:hypothetical protein